METVDLKTVESFVADVRTFSEGRILGALSQSISDVDVKAMMPGKMLRTRLAGRLSAGSPLSGCPAIQALCAATELVHTASLCHDDVVDNSLIRRSLPTLWQSVGASGAILIGDLLLSEAVDIVMAVENGRYLPNFISKIKQVVQAEAQQELLWRGKQVDVDTCLDLARGKTGPLFAFTAGICAGEDEKLSGLLEEAGYRIGTAYQLADDLVDILGSEGVVGKTLGTDLVRGKFTLPQNGETGERVTQENISDLCNSAVELLNDYPQAKKGLTEFLCQDIQSLLKQTLDVETEITI